MGSRVSVNIVRKRVSKRFTVSRKKRKQTYWEDAQENLNKLGSKVNDRKRQQLPTKVVRVPKPRTRSNPLSQKRGGERSITKKSLTSLLRRPRLEKNLEKHLPRDRHIGEEGNRKSLSPRNIKRIIL